MPRAVSPTASSELPPIPPPPCPLSIGGNTKNTVLPPGTATPPPYTTITKRSNTR